MLYVGGQRATNQLLFPAYLKAVVQCVRERQVNPLQPPPSWLDEKYSHLYPTRPTHPLPVQKVSLASSSDAESCWVEHSIMRL